MAEELSKIATILEDMGKCITEDVNFKTIPIKWHMFEVSPNNMPPTVVVLEPKPFQLDDSGCNYERQLDVIIIHNTDYEREITIRLTKYSELMLDLLNEHIINNPVNYELKFLQGSEIRALRNNREDSESYKGSKTLFSSLIVLSYLLRY